MIQMLPLLCLIGFAIFMEFRLKKEITEIHDELNKIKRNINNEKRSNN